MKRILISGLLALVGSGVAGCRADPPPPPVPPTPASIVSFTVTPAQAAPGTSVLLSWETEHATHHTLRRRDGSPVELDEPGRGSGSLEWVVEADEVFLLTARGLGGSDSAAAAVAVQEKSEREPLFAVVPDEVPAGDPATLVWSVPGEGAVQVADASGAVIYEGAARASSRVVRPTADQTYTLTADGKSAQVQVTVRPVINAFAAAQTAVALGESVTLHWSVLGATALTISSDGRGDLHTQADPAAMADGTFTEVVDFGSPVDGVVRYRLEAVAGGKTVGAVLEVGVGVEPVFTSLQVPAYAAQGTTYPVSWKTARADRVEILRDDVLIHVAQSSADVAQGGITVQSPDELHSLTFRATNARGGQQVETRTVETVAPPVFNTFAANPSPLPQGSDPVMLSWDVTHARRVRVSVQGGPQLTEILGNGAESGQVPVYPNKQTTYVLEADNQVGDAISAQTLTVEVTNPARLVFSPPTVPNNTPVQLVGTNPALSGQVRMETAIVKNAPGDDFVDILSSGTQLPVGVEDDTVSYLISLPEPFSTRIMGTEVTSNTVNVSINGWFSFSPSTIGGPSIPANSLPTTALPHLAIAPYLEDLESNASTRVLWRLDGAGQERRLIIQWDQLPFYPSPTSPKRVTFQAQVWASGKIVFAYQNITGVTASDVPAIGMQNHNSTAAITPPASFFTSGQPASGDRVTFGGIVTLPVEIIATTTPISIDVEVVPGTWITIVDAPNIIPPGQFGISEVNFNPAAGQAEWFEVQNNTAGPIDLNGWTINFGGGLTHPIAGQLVIPPNGYVVLGQTSGAAEGATVDYVYGTGFSMPDAAGTLSLGIAGGTYSTVTWTSPGTQGASLQVGIAQPELMLAAGAPPSTCRSFGPYGSSGQFGSPGAVNARCFTYTLQPAGPSGFESILATGATPGTMTATSDEVLAQITLPRPITLFGEPRANLWISTNGFLTFVSTSDAKYLNDTVVGTTLPNGVIAPFWDDLHGQAGAGVRWQQFDPDGTPGSGDEYTLVSWEGWKIVGTVSNVSFQVRFDEGTGDIEFHYGAMTSADTGGSRALGSSATTWLENGGGTAARVYNVSSPNNPGITPFTSIRYAFTP